MDMKMKKSFSEKTFSLKQNKTDDEIKNMKRSISDKTLFPKPKNKYDDNTNAKSNRFLITINVFGSAGPIRFIVNEDDNAAGVIETALKLYAREGRFPMLGSDIKTFFLYPANAGFDGSWFWTYDQDFGCSPQIIGGNRIVWSEEFCSVQEPEQTAYDRSQIRDD